MLMLQKLRNLAIDREDVEGCVEMLAYGELIASKFTANEIPTPEWLTDTLGSLRNELKARRRDALEKALKEAKIKRSNLMTAEEKRAQTTAEIERLERELGLRT